jgi:hypothetical protein
MLNRNVVSAGLVVNPYSTAAYRRICYTYSCLQPVNPTSAGMQVLLKCCCCCCEH